MMRRRKLKKKRCKWCSVAWTPKANYKLLNFYPTKEKIWQGCIFSVIYHLSLLVIIITAWWNVFLKITVPLLKKIKWQGCGPVRAFQKHFVSTYTPIYINHTINVFTSWPSTSKSPIHTHTYTPTIHLCMLHNRIHKTDDNRLQRSSLPGKGEVLLNNLTWIHRMGQSGRWDRCTCWVWSRNHLHMNSGKSLQRGTWHLVKQHKNVHYKVQDEIRIQRSLYGARICLDCAWEKIHVSVVCQPVGSRFWISG